MTGKADETKTIDAVDSDANVSAVEETKASEGQGLIGRKVVLNANGMQLAGEITGSKAGDTNGACTVTVDGTDYDATGYGWEKSQYHFEGEERPDEYKANANAR